MDTDGTALVSNEVATKDLHRAGGAADARVLAAGETVSLEGALGREVGATVALLEALVALDVATHQKASLAQTEGQSS